MKPIEYAIYLHGFASSPQSSKAQRYHRELTSLGIGFGCPDFNDPDFEHLTVTRMLEQTGQMVGAIHASPIALVGSSLGAFVAVHAAEHDATKRIDRLILLAPALDFGGNRLRQLGTQGIDEWRRAGRLRVFHYGENEPRDIGFGLYEDAAQYDAFAVGRTLPTLIYQGRRDESVDPAMVERWAADRPNVDLRMLDDTHQLTDSIEEIWAGSREFLGITT